MFSTTQRKEACRERMKTILRDKRRILTALKPWAQLDHCPPHIALLSPFLDYIGH